MPLLSASRKATVLAPPLPVTNSVFAQHGLVFRRGQLSLVAAAPSVGKTLLAANLSIRTPASSAVPGGPPRGNLYFSADSDEWTVKQRACSILTGVKLNTVEQQLGEDSWDQFYTDTLRLADHVDWCYQTDIDPEFIVQRIFSYAELRGDFPQLIVVDNLGNTVVDQDNEGSELRAICRELQRLARITGAHVMGLHHVTGPKENGLQPIFLGDLLYKLGKIPEQVLGMNWIDVQRSGLNVTVPKFRGGKGGISFQLPVDYTTATVGGFQVGMTK
jgi:hypothetical protein